MNKKTLEFLKNLADQKMNILDYNCEYEEMNLAQRETYRNCQNAIAEINEELKIKKDTSIVVRELNIYLQWKSDCWRNTAIQLFEAIKSSSPVDIKKAKKRFRAVKKMFPYTVL